MKFKDVPLPVQKYLVEGFRKAFKFSTIPYDFKKTKRIERAKYKKDGNLSKKKDVSFPCNICEKELKEAKSELHIDHRIPVVPLHLTLQDMTFTDYYKRTMTKDLQILCKPCHYKKTAIEKKIRNYFQEKKIGVKKVTQDEWEEYEKNIYLQDLRTAVGLTKTCMEYTYIDETRDMYARCIKRYEQKIKDIESGVIQIPEEYKLI